MKRRSMDPIQRLSQTPPAPPLPSYYAGTSLLSYTSQWCQQWLQTQRKDTYPYHNNNNNNNSTSNGDNVVNDAGEGSAATTTLSTVFGLAFLDSVEPNIHWLCGCTSNGELCVWKLHHKNNNKTSRPRPQNFDKMDDDDDDDDDDDEENETFDFRSTLTSSAPVLRLQISKRVLYACQAVKCSPTYSDHWIVVAGDDGVYILDWNTEILPKIQQQQQNRASSSTPLREAHCVRQPYTPRRQFRTHPSATESCVEINDFAMQDDNRYLYGAAGDAFGCYKWDVETGTCTTYNTTTTTGGGGFHNYLHTLDCVPHTNLLLTGGEDGMLAIWDTAQDKLVDTIGVVSRSAAPGISSSSNVTAPPYKRRSMAAAAAASGMNNDDNSHGWISTCKARDENWWTVAGGRNTTSTGGGFVSTWHGPTRSLVSCVETREVPQQLAFYNSSNNNNNNNSGGGNTKLLSVANESFISHWPNPLSLCGPEANSGDKNNYGESHLHSPVRQRVWCHQPSAYAVAVSPDGQRIATGGVGSVVDIFENGTQYGMQLSTH